MFVSILGFREIASKWIRCESRLKHQDNMSMKSKPLESKCYIVKLGCERVHKYSYFCSITYIVDTR